jgi:hypothetical protein
VRVTPAECDKSLEHPLSGAPCLTKKGAEAGALSCLVWCVVWAAGSHDGGGQWLEVRADVSSTHPWGDATPAVAPLHGREGQQRRSLFSEAGRRSVRGILWGMLRDGVRGAAGMKQYGGWRWVHVYTEEGGRMGVGDFR